MLVTEYNFLMARGWESKSVEQQQDEATSHFGTAKLRLTPEEQEKSRKKQGLLLSRRRIEQQIQATQSPRHREMLLAALTELDTQISRLE
jgi:hypothetical protein